MTVEITIHEEQANWGGWFRVKEDNHLTCRVKIKWYELFKLLKKFKPKRWKIVYGNRFTSFLYWLGQQNDYLYPPKGEEQGVYPFRKPHLWKTRFGFGTAWDLAKIING